MKTTVYIPNALLTRAKRLAARRKITVREVIEASLSAYLDAEEARKATFKLEDGSVPGHGVAPGIIEGDWSTIRSLVYEGRGG